MVKDLDFEFFSSWNHAIVKLYYSFLLSHITVKFHFIFFIMGSILMRNYQILFTLIVFLKEILILGVYYFNSFFYRYHLHIILLIALNETSIFLWYIHSFLQFLSVCLHISLRNITLCRHIFSSISKTKYNDYQKFIY